MPVVLDPYRLVSALKSTGKNANFTAEEIASAVDASQQDSDLLTKSAFDAAMVRFEAALETKLSRFEAKHAGQEGKITGLEAKIELVRADIRAELRTTQVQTLLWLGGIMLASNGAVIALLARMAHVI